jgi:heat shock protein HtpX
MVPRPAGHRVLPLPPGDPWLAARAFGLVAVMAALMAGMGWLWAGPTGVGLALALAAAEAALLPVAGPRTVMRMMRGQPLPWPQGAEIHAMAETLARRAGLARRPGLYITPGPAVEAVAVGGREEDVVALSAGALRHLSPREMAGVLAHEISHLASGDIRLFRLVGAMAASIRALGLAGASFAGVLVLGGDDPAGIGGFLAAFVAAPLLATLAEAALWRLREFAADDGAVALTGDPAGLASALGRIEVLHGDPLWRLLRGLRRTAPGPAALRTHPRTRDRIARLLRQAGASPF